MSTKHSTDPRIDALLSWWGDGERIAIEIGTEGTRYEVHCRVDGARGPWLVFLHGFPTCSFDWAQLVPVLARTHRVLTLDLLGYGASDKPRKCAFGTDLHAAIVLALFQRFAIESAHIVAHDIGTAIAQELVFRSNQGRILTRIEAVTFLNGVVFVDHYRPRLLQRMLSNPITGRVMAAVHDERIFTRSFRGAFGPTTRPDDATCALYFRAMRERDGHRLLHRLAYYVNERITQGPRWQAALVRTRIPLSFIWGMADPYAGAFVAEDIRHHLPRAPVHELAGIGHFPHLEAKDDVLAILARSQNYAA